MGDFKGDTGSLDYSPYGSFPGLGGPQYRPPKYDNPYCRDPLIRYPYFC